MKTRFFLKPYALVLLCGMVVVFLNCKNKEDADLAFSFCNVGDFQTVVGKPVVLNTSIINEVFPGDKAGAAPARGKDAEASHRLITCAFRPDTLSLWSDNIEMEDIRGMVNDEIVKTIDAIPSGHVLYYVDAIIFNEPGYYQFTVALDCFGEVEERDENNNIARPLDLIRAAENVYPLTICVKGDAIPSKTKIKMIN